MEILISLKLNDSQIFRVWLDEQPFALSQSRLRVSSRSSLLTPYDISSGAPQLWRGCAGWDFTLSPKIIVLAQQRGQLRTGDRDGEEWEQDEEPLTLTFAQLYIATVLHTRNALILYCMMFSIVSCGLAAGSTEHNVLSAVQQWDLVFRLRAGFYP